MSIACAENAYHGFRPPEDDSLKIVLPTESALQRWAKPVSLFSCMQQPHLCVQLYLIHILSSWAVAAFSLQQPRQPRGRSSVSQSLEPCREQQSPAPTSRACREDQCGKICKGFKKLNKACTCLSGNSRRSANTLVS